MTRTQIKLRKIGETIEVCHGDAWHATTLSAKMKLDNRSLPNVKALLDNYLDPNYLANNTWDLRIGEQRKIGSALRRSVFGDLNVAIGAHLHFVPVLHPHDTDGNEEFIDFLTRVPWSMLTRSNDPESEFLALGIAKPVAITIDAFPTLEERPLCYKIRQSVAPRLLLVMPEVIHDDPRKNTEATAHRGALLDILRPHYENCGAPENIECVRTFQEYSALLLDKHFYPEIIYFYGHGSTLGKGARFQFEHDGQADWRPVEEIQRDIKRVADVTDSPPLIWFNACQGAAASQDSALRIFAKTASCVVAMRTVVGMATSRMLAEKALKSIIIDGFDPPTAIRETLRKSPGDWMRSGHWASITVATQFIDWTALGNSRPVAEANDAVGDFPSRVDRTEALIKIETILATDLAASASKPDPSVLIWTGSEDEMPVHFGERTRDVIMERFPGHRPIFMKVELQQGIRPGQRRELENQLLVALMIALSDGLWTQSANLADIRSAILNISPGSKGVLALYHGPLTAAHAGLVHIYIQLWKAICQDLADAPTAPKIALAFGFVSEAGNALVLPKGTDAIRLGTVPPGEIKSHLSRYRRLYNIPPGDLDAKTTELAEDTAGIFTKLLERLQQMANFWK